MTDDEGDRARTHALERRYLAIQRERVALTRAFMAVRREGGQAALEQVILSLLRLRRTLDARGRGA